jgi:Mg2+-importing ATPase
LLLATSLAALAAAPILVLSPAAAILGFVPVPGGLAVTIAVIVLAYLACAELAKRQVDRMREARPPKNRAWQHF